MRDRLRFLWFCSLPALFLLLVLEFVSLAVYFQERGPEISGLQAAIGDLRHKMVERRARQSVLDLELPRPREIFDALYSPMGSALLEEFRQTYTSHFQSLVESVEAADSKLVVLYIPPVLDSSLARRVANADRAFYEPLARDDGALWIDTTPTFASVPGVDWTLSPHNIHLSHRGHRLLAEAVVEPLRSLATKRSLVTHEHRPARLGDLPPGRRIWPDTLFPFLVTVNAQGLRAEYDLEFPKRGQRVLLLGDSFTFGSNAHDVEIWPRLLGEKLPQIEVVNAGVPGYTIEQEAALFIERARYAEPDITVLQVLFNDLYGFFCFQRRSFARDRWSDQAIWGVQPLPTKDCEGSSPLEREFFRALDALQSRAPEDTSEQIRGVPAATL